MTPLNWKTTSKLENPVLSGTARGVGVGRYRISGSAGGDYTVTLRRKGRQSYFEEIATVATLGEAMEAARADYAWRSRRDD
jgi:hypothetical protein